ncbi:protein OSCP1 [Chelonus insularis]|uniref:protein OSCP1 n=1 Tax=Chelonus insularis TaxID=460826 RepID=UPI00158A26CD|nr:protein OSCP1 [Chelonus insularis]
MSLYANPLLFLNMGGEMLYVIHQRLKAQKIEIRKARQVIEDITAAFVNPKIIEIIMQESPCQELSWMQTTLEKIALCSIMKLDKNSVHKLFDLMMMIVKYQLTAATGPREVILLTLNHLASIRDNVIRKNTHESMISLHKVFIDFYSKLTHNDIWEARNTCLNKLATINVRVSVLLRLSLQNEDTTFNINPKYYNEKYKERESELGSLKLTEGWPQIGSLAYDGDRVTILGKNMYSSSYANPPEPKSPLNQSNKIVPRDKGSKIELELLAKQLGTDNSKNKSMPTSFNFDIFIDDVEMKTNDSNSGEDNEEHNVKKLKNEKLHNDYKAKLEDICADFMDSSTVNRQMNLLQLLDDTE